MRGEGVDLPAEAELAVRERGWSESSRDWPDGARGVAVPLFDATGACVAALSITAPGDRFELDRFVAALRRQSDRINDYLNGAAENPIGDAPNG